MNDQEMIFINLLISKITRYVITSLIVTSHLFAQNYPTKSELIKGVDVSALYEIEEYGGIFKENGNPKDALEIFSDHGINFVRLRIWHTPNFGYCNLTKTLIMASRIKNLGLKFLLDIHYSDTWADPGQQTKPFSWQNLSVQELKDSVYQYTFNILTALKHQNTLPDIVQIGNEITCGMLWNDGRVCDQFNSPEQWAQLGELINEAIRGVNESLDPGDTIKTLIHIDRGGDNSGSQWFFDHLSAQNVEFDIIGLSYYPWWQGTLVDLELNLHDLAQRYGKEIIIVETAYPWTLDWNDNTHNIVGDTSQLHPGYPSTVEGQTNFLHDLFNLVIDIPEGKGLGLFYWAPEWVSTPALGSPWENVTLFDFSGELLSSISAFDSTTSIVQILNEELNSFNLYQNYPNPFNSSTIIKYEIPHGSFVTLKLFNVLGNEIAILVDDFKPAGFHKLNFNAENLPSGIYFYIIKAEKFIDSKKMILLK
jgi:arabinogalactan endo-1,4-beta-galactosidase